MPGDVNGSTTVAGAPSIGMAEVPKVYDAHAIAQNISSALVKMNYCGPVSISTYGDTNYIPDFVQHALSSTDIALNHVPATSPTRSWPTISVHQTLDFKNHTSRIPHLTEEREGGREREVEVGPALKGTWWRGWTDGKEEMGKGVGCGVAGQDFWG
ncbi:hypothetical protein DVH24_028988 [Malus domestica]|uniref:NYN domain-containing protein n=1 Tax=Malus domestica TaxID=3750 RepID=A0A498HXH7_MALDO|nr:hypothetical protein DVH24_028988 [Malus domestica]